MQNRVAMTSRSLVWVGLLAWAIVVAIYLTPALALPQPVRTAFFFSLFGFAIVFWLATRGSCRGRLETILIAAQTALALGCMACDPRNAAFLPILLVIVAGQLGHVPLRFALLWIAIQSAAIALVLDHREALPLALAYFTIQLFGAITARMAAEEREAKQALAEANTELRVATGLLDMNSRAEERLRIARELHDLLGHHLTALSINLEVANHLAGGAVKQHIEKSQALTKLLLSDVRDSVNRLRDDEPVDLATALRSIRDAVPSPAIHVEANGIRVSAPVVARTALRAVQEIVANAVRHSGARNLWLNLYEHDGSLAIDARDDGNGIDHVQFGNGLRGMRERVRESGGTMDVASMRGRGFELHLRLPLEGTVA